MCQNKTCIYNFLGSFCESLTEINARHGCWKISSYSSVRFPIPMKIKENVRLFLDGFSALDVLSNGKVKSV